MPALQDLTEEQTRIFAILDKLDPVDTSKLPFVKLDLGEFSRDADGKPVHGIDHAFLVKDEEGSQDFTVRLLNLIVRTYRSPGTTHSPGNLAEFAREEARRLVEGEDSSVLVARGIFDDRCRTLLLARACARAKLWDEARSLLKALGPLEDLIEPLSDGFSRRLIRDVFESNLDRLHLRDRHQAWLTCFPNSSVRGDVEARLTLLQRMIKEDEAWAARPKPRNRAEEIEALVFDLRNETQPLREEWISSGSGHLVRELTPEQQALRPARRVVAAGLDAVPVLVARLEDERVTRCVSYYEDQYDLVTIGTMAELVLIELSGLEFTGEVAERHQSWRKWSKSLVENGEEKSLSELVVRGGDQADAAAERLLKKWPGRVADVIQGAQVAPDPFMRRRLVAQLGAFKDESVTAFLIEEAERGPELLARVEAGDLLLDRGRREGLDALARAWNELPKASDESPEERRVRQHDRFIALHELAWFLASSGDVATLRSISKDLASRPPEVRASLLKVIRDARRVDLLRRCEATRRAPVEAELEGILVSFLQDRFRFDRGRPCDLAGACLIKMWPERYPDFPRGPSRIRDRHWLSFANGWRKRNGLEPLPEPSRPDPRSKDPDISKLIDRFLAEADSDAREGLGKQLESKGLGALPWIAEALKARPAGGEAVSELKGVADKLANHVASASLAAKGWKAPKNLEDWVEGLKGRALTYEDVVEILLAALNALPDKAGTATLQVERLPGLGVHVEFEVAPGPVDDGRGASSTWEVCGDGDDGGQISGGGGRRLYDDVGDFRRYGTHLENALKTSFDRYFESTIQLTYD